MAVSAFKSSSRRTTTSTNTTSKVTTSPSSSSNSSSTRTGRPTAAGETNSPKKPAVAHRRSRSVSAFSRRETLAPSSNSSTSDYFLNKRDNPLFSSNSSPPEQEAEKRSDGLVTSSGGGDDRRGRSAVRNVGVGGGGGGGGGGGVGARKEVGRSLSRGVDPVRRNRSVSRCPVSRGTGQRFVNSESETDQEYGSVMKTRRGFNTDVESDYQDKKGLIRTTSGFDSIDRMKGLRTWTSQHSAPEASHESPLSRMNPNTCSSIGVEEKTIKLISEQMKSPARGNPVEGDDHDATNDIYETVRSEVRRAISEIQNDLGKAIGRSNSSAIATANITDIPPDLVNPSAVELVSDIRKEYAIKLEQSHERARKLREDLAVEEHRGLELTRILKDVLPDPKTPSVHKSRPARKASIERRKMSKRLTDEAMAYFDECVSLSTFDSSDFSSQEDPPVNIIGVASTPISNSVLSLQTSSSASASNRFTTYFKDKQGFVGQGQIANIHDNTDQMASSSYNEPHLDQFSSRSMNASRDWKSPFSFSRKPTETPDLQMDIQKYIRNSEKDNDITDSDSRFVRSNDYDLGEYRLQELAESSVLDRVVMRNEIESGRLLLCSGGISVSSSPFASFF